MKSKKEQLLYNIIINNDSSDFNESVMYDFEAGISEKYQNQFHFSYLVSAGAFLTFLLNKQIIEHKEISTTNPKEIQEIHLKYSRKYIKKNKEANTFFVELTAKQLGKLKQYAKNSAKLYQQSPEQIALIDQDQHDNSTCCISCNIM